MNEQELADLFSEQLDRLLEGEPVSLPPAAQDVQELLDIFGPPVSNTQFQPSAAAQAAFQSQVASWAGLASEGIPMTILGLSKVWFISIIVTVLVVTTGLGLVAVVTTGLFIFGSSAVPATPTPVTIGTPVAGGTPVVTGTVVSSATVVATSSPTASITVTTSPTASVTAVPSGTPGTPMPTNIFVLQFQSNIQIATLCQGAYVSQQTLVNVGDTPINDAGLVWEVVEGADLIEGVNIVSPSLLPVSTNNSGTVTPSSSPGAISSTSIVNTSFVNFNSIPVQEEVKLDVKVKVNSKWWDKPDGTKIKVKLSVKSKIEIEHDFDDDDDDDNHGQGHGHNRIITIVKQGAQWITLSGVAHQHGDHQLLVDGTVVAINNCTGLPPQLTPGSNVKIIGILQPNGTFIAINIIIINVNVFTGDFDSGVPTGGDGGNDNDDGGSGGGGGGDGGSKKGGSNKGGSKKGGSKGGS
jgi:uncharacterized membrane protein YgcG